jgi:hypothetical protein
MISLINNANGELIGTIDEETLEFLMDNLEEEWADDTDYYFNQDTIDFLQENGANEKLLAILTAAIAETGDADIRWAQA